MTDAIDGVLRVDKAAGPTSHDVVALVRRAMGTRRVGHTGTLDPFATGLLLVCAGRATRLAEYLSGLPKRYRATARLGQATDTDDRTGAVVAQADGWRDLSEAEVKDALRTLEGDIMQRPPAYSAKKIGGTRAYRLAREGEAPELEPVRVTVHAIELLELRLPELVFDVECSSGTYVRALARDAGQALGVGGHLVELRRTAIGAHGVAGAVPLDGLDDADARRAAWLDPLEALAHLPVVSIGPEDAQRVRHGGAVEARSHAPDDPAAGADSASTVVALEFEGALLAIAEARDGRIHPRKVFV